MLHSEERRLIVNINHVRNYNREYANGLLESPSEYLPAFEKALYEVAQSVQDPTTPLPPSVTTFDFPFAIGLEGSFGTHSLQPRTVTSIALGTLISIEGIVTKCSLVRPKIARSVHYCENTLLFHAREYRDGTSLGNAIPTGTIYPKEDENGNPLTTEFGFSTYRDYQTIGLQEMPERAPAGQLPRPIDVILEQDLVDSVKPGDRVQIVGVYRSLGKHAASVNAIFRTVILANNVRQLTKDIQQPTITDWDITNIREVSKKKNLFELMSLSLAPSIYGHDYIKKAILLQLLGGVEKNLVNGTHLRGDINMLLIGDPSTAKSQMLRFVLNLAPLAIATTGRGSSGVGLTAAVTQDKETGERTLEAGAMVLADRGIVCIDEFDKMSDVDRVAIHEVMEQQTVTIAKAGIHTSLNARCSVLAAANPAYGHYMVDRPPHENILLPDSLLSRFDLVFVVLDAASDELNRMLADHICRVHRYVPPGLDEGQPITDAYVQSMSRTGVIGTLESDGQAMDSESSVTEVYQRYNKLLHVGLRSYEGGLTDGDKPMELLSIPFIKKYLHYAKTRVHPVLNQEAAEFIANQYGDLRNGKQTEHDRFRTMPVTARTLETLIRLASAHAKLRLSKTVELDDAEVALEILKFAMFKEANSRAEKIATTRRNNMRNVAGNDIYAKKIRMQATTSKIMEDNDVSDRELISEEGSDEETTRNRPQDMEPTMNESDDELSNKENEEMFTAMNETRTKEFMHQLNRYRGQHSDSYMHKLQDIIKWINDNSDITPKFRKEELFDLLRNMTKNNKFWYHESNDEIMFV